jgi:hypothetical protein
LDNGDVLHGSLHMQLVVVGLSPLYWLARTPLRSATHCLECVRSTEGGEKASW